jgi:hypothetical protein
MALVVDVVGVNTMMSFLGCAASLQAGHTDILPMTTLCTPI